MTQRNDPVGAQFEIAVEGVARSYRDDKAIALDAAKVLKAKTPGLKVTVRDMRDNGGIRRTSSTSTTFGYSECYFF